MLLGAHCLGWHSTLLSPEFIRLEQGLCFWNTRKGRPSHWRKTSRRTSEGWYPESNEWTPACADVTNHKTAARFQQMDTGLRRCDEVFFSHVPSAEVEKVDVNALPEVEAVIQADVLDWNFWISEQL
jgi:hypothetical protein